MPENITIGSLVAGYRIDGLLGQGAMGSVYAATDEHLLRRAAIKVLAPEYARDERFRERFLRESRTAAALEHPAIVPIYGAGEVDGLLYIAMRLIDGRDLRALLDERRVVEPAAVVAIARQVAGALDAAHAAGLVHRDVKPANVMLEGERAFLCDFGLARHFSSAASLTGERAVVGTLDYVAPEQIEGGATGPGADIYGLGCTVFECLTGSKPFLRDTELSLVFAHLTDPPPSASARQPQLPAAVDGVIARVLAKVPEARPVSAGAFVDELAVAVGLESPDATTTRPTTTARAFLIGDIRGYTAYTRERGDEAAARLASRFGSLARAEITTHGGYGVEIRGDEVMAVFDSARDATRCALAIQAAVVGADLERGVGIGLDAGEAVPVDGGFRGAALNVAARLCSLAATGEVLASDTIVRLAGPLEEVRYGDRRTEQLKGLARPLAVIEVLPAALPARPWLERTRRRLGRRRRTLAIGALVVAAGGAVAAAVVSQSGDAPPPKAKAPALPKLPANGIALFDATTLAYRGQVPSLGDEPATVLFPRGLPWVYQPGVPELARIDAATRAVTKRVGLPAAGWATIDPSGTIYTSDDREGSIRIVDTTQATVGETIEIPVWKESFTHGTHALTFAAGSLWAAFGGPFRIARIDPSTRKVIAEIELPNACCDGLVASDGTTIWAADRRAGRLWRIDPGTNTIAATATVPRDFIEDLAVGRGEAFVPLQNASGVWQIAETGDPVRFIHTGWLPYSVSFADGAAWVANANERTVTRIDPATGATRTIRLAGRPTSAVVHDGQLWVTLGTPPPDPLAGLAGLTVAQFAAEADPYIGVDPALNFQALTFQLRQATDVQLVTLDDRSRPGGPRIVAGLADPPLIEDGGSTLRFRIRPGYRFSPPSGQPVTAEAVRFSLERALSPKLAEQGSVAPGFLQDIVGARAFSAGKAEHVSGIAIDGETVTIRLTAPNGDLPYRLALPMFSIVPPGTPTTLTSYPPSAGPFYVAGYYPDSHIVLRRNPNFPASPAGGRRQFDAYVIRLNLSNAVAVAEIERAALDGVTIAKVNDRAPDLMPGGRLEKTYANPAPGKPRFFSVAGSATTFLQFNTVRGVFRDARLRRAVSQALSGQPRQEIAHALAGVPTDRLIPPGVVGYDATAAVGGAPAPSALFRVHSTLLVRDEPRSRQVAQIITQALAAIGMTVKVDVVEQPWQVARDPTAGFDMFINDWFADYQDGYDILNLLFDAKGATRYWGAESPDLFRDRAALARLRATATVTGDARAGAYADLDASLAAGDAPFAALSYLTASTLASPRVGCLEIDLLSSLPDLTRLCPT